LPLSIARADMIGFGKTSCEERVRYGVPCQLGEKSPQNSLRGFERFYEKVIKVKADVAAFLDFFQ
jgi:hypothetical protein